MMTFKIISLGCKVNSYECSALRSLLISSGYVEAKDNNVDVAIINTCSVTATADQKSRQHIRKLRKLYPNSIVVVMGCYSQKNHQYTIDELGADIVVGTSNRAKIPELIGKFHLNKEKIDETEEKARFFNYEEMGVTSFSENVRAYLKIQDGCDNFCSYCTIPLTRGKSRSRSKEKVIEEAKYLIGNGYQEIVLTGIHVGGYGQDLVGYTFSDLVDDLSSLPNLKSLRISSIEESEIDDKLIRLLKERNNIAKHMHIPLQSGSTKVLKEMNRKYDEDAFIDKLQKIREAVPDIALTTDVIVGFPNESNEDFNETIKTIKAAGFNMLHVFPFSARENTKAFYMKNQISPSVKSERSHILLKLSDELWDEYTNRFNNKEVEVLIEEYDKEKGLYRGHTTNYLEVFVKSETNIIGKYIKTIYKK